MTDRQAKILAAIVTLHSKTGYPVSSKELLEQFEMHCSSATIRSEMSELEKLGLIIQPHTSAGRIPTDEGYRLFINKFISLVNLSNREQIRLKKELEELRSQQIELSRKISKLVSSHSNQASFAVLPNNVSTSGISHIVNNNIPQEDIKQVVNFLDNIEEIKHELINYISHSSSGEEPVTIIGKEVSLSPNSNYSIILSRIPLENNQTGIIGIIGPKAMPYQKNLSLLSYISKLFNTTPPVIMLLILITQ